MKNKFEDDSNKFALNGLFFAIFFSYNLINTCTNLTGPQIIFLYFFDCVKSRTLKDKYQKASRIKNPEGFFT